MKKEKIAGKMNRIIKFRVWIPFSMNGTPPEMRQFEQIKNDTIGSLFHATSINYMQFTGLLDKNGLEIFKGDLIKQQDYKEPLEVYFCKDCAGFRARLNGFGNNELIKEDCEIIGNIYENEGK